MAKDTRSNEGVAVATPPISVRISPSGTSVVEIFCAGVERPLVLHLPASVAEIVSQEVEEGARIENPADALARSYKDWEEGKGLEVSVWGKGVVTCFVDFFGGVPELLFWTLEHFSAPEFPLTHGQKFDLAFHTFKEAEEILGNNVSNLTSTATSDTLEYCWYFLARLLAIEARLAGSDPSIPAVELHLWLIRCHYCLLLRLLKGYHEEGWITAACPKDDIERKLIDLAANRPKLKPFAAQIIRDWARLEQDATRLERLTEFRTEYLEAREREPADDVDDSGSDENISTSVKKQGYVMGQIRCLERLMTPQSTDDPAWHHPLEFVENRAKGRQVLFFKPSIAPSSGDDFANGQKFEFAFLERMAENGFRHWLHAKPEDRLRFIHRWLKGKDDSRSLKGLLETF